jgi:hypothetical protein
MSILAALVLPALSRAQGQARSVTCKNHLCQMGLALKMYVVSGRSKPATSGRIKPSHFEVR